MDESLRILEGILHQPTAPFHEHRVRGRIQAELDRARIPWKLDPSGNLVARYRHGKARPVAFLAHMDHPGFEILSVKGGTAVARWNGQIPTFPLKGLRLALWSDGPEGRRGTAVALDLDGRNPKLREFRMRVPAGTRAADFGYADLTPFALRRGFIVSKALDNVAGCAAITSALVHLACRRMPGNVTALFTRAEEVGFHGTLGAIRDGTLPRRLPVVVLECSRALPGAEQGKGPVVRVGDRASVFDPDLAAACADAAKASGIPHQRRLMDGGVCEASAFGLSGYRSVCLAFPLGAYHNVGKRGVEPEFIAEGDFLGGVACLAAFASPGLDPSGARRRLAAWAWGRFGPAEARRLRETSSLGVPSGSSGPPRVGRSQP